VVTFAPGNPDEIYIGTGEYVGTSPSNHVGVGILKSVNGGQSWALMGQSSFDRATVRRLRVDPNDADVVVAASAHLLNPAAEGWRLVLLVEWFSAAERLPADACGNRRLSHLHFLYNRPPALLVERRNLQPNDRRSVHQGTAFVNTSRLTQE
jgi:hypothetical protein